MNINITELILLCTTVIFAMLSASLILMKITQRKTVIKALQNSSEALKVHLSHNETTLKNTLEPMLTPDLEKKITELVTVERDSYRNLIKLYVDYHPAAIEMMPVLMNQIISSYIQCFEHVVLVHPQNKEPVPNPTLESDDLPDNFQYEALIEQLRYEKQDFANKYKDASKLLKTICTNHKDHLKLTINESLEHMSLADIAKIFNIQFTPTKTELI